MSAIKLNVNGKERSVDVSPDMPLLWVLRDTMNLTGTKFGCGMSMCGACTVHVNGEAVRSCVTPISSVVGKKITTIEGLSAEHEPSATDRLGAAQRAAVRLLPERADHAGGGASQAEAQTDGRGY